MLCQDYTYRYPHPVLITEGRCRVRLYKGFDGGYTVLLTELADNPGESVTNACERIATGVQPRWALDLTTTRWIEHYPAESFREKGRGATFDEITFTWGDGTASHPQWHRLPLEVVEILTGLAFDETPAATG